MVQTVVGMITCGLKTVNLRTFLMGMDSGSLGELL